MVDVFPAVVYVLCFLTSAACAWLLGRSYRQNGTGLLLWSSVCFVFLALDWSKWNPVWGYGLVVEVEGTRDGQRVRYTYRNEHPPHAEWGGSRAYYKCVGIPLSIGAQMIARGEVEGCGVLPPEQALPADTFLAELAKRGITYQEEVEVLS